jgi:hypothetical protein
MLGRMSVHRHRQRQHERDEYENRSRKIRHEPHLVTLTRDGPHADYIPPAS